MKLASLLVFSLSCGIAHAQLTSDRLLDISKEPRNWLTYNDSYTSQRYSLLDQINQSKGSEVVAIDARERPCVLGLPLRSTVSTCT
jgi:hypothetical protein